MQDELKSEVKPILMESDDLVSCMQGQVPVILVSSTHPQGHVVKAVNFLRSGCPDVQIVFDYNIEGSRRTEWHDSAIEILNELASGADDGEIFTIYTKFTNIEDSICLSIAREIKG